MKKAKLLWVDLEMTGLDVKKEKIMEVAAIATDWSFEEFGTLEAIVRVEDGILELMDEWNQTQHNGSGLVEKVRTSELTSEAAEVQLLEFVRKHFADDERIILAGNSIHQDRKFIDQEWPALSEKLHYRMLDVSAWKVVFDGKYRKRFAKPEAHRALQDVRGSIEELKYYLGKVKV